LRTFLLALAVIDDIGAILVIAFVYSTGVLANWLIGALLVVVAIHVMKKLNLNSVSLYVPVGIILWYCMYRGGIHPTLAGVILGLMTPNIVRVNTRLIDADDHEVSVIEWLENKLHPISSLIIVPLFAFANTGVQITSSSISAAYSSPIAWGIFFGLVIGKPLGVIASTWGSKKISLGEYPEGATLPKGIGFTVAIFIANLAFSDRPTQELAIIAVIVASLVSGILSTIIFKVFSNK
jgi:NhaA family Na+:H+ antiporter